MDDTEFLPLLVFLLAFFLVIRGTDAQRLVYMQWKCLNVERQLWIFSTYIGTVYTIFLTNGFPEQILFVGQEIPGKNFGSETTALLWRYYASHEVEVLVFQWEYSIPNTVVNV